MLSWQPEFKSDLIKIRLLALEILMFEGFPIVSLCRLSTPLGMAKFDPRGRIGRIYIEDH